MFGSACFASPERLEESQRSNQGLPIYQPSEDLVKAIVEDDIEQLGKLFELNGGDWLMRMRFDKSMNVLNFAVD